MNGTTTTIERDGNVLFGDFRGHKARVVDFEGKPWFVAKDVGDILGMERIAGYGWMMHHLEESERRLITRDNVNCIADKTFPRRGAVCILRAAFIGSSCARTNLRLTTSKTGLSKRFSLRSERPAGIS